MPLPIELLRFFDQGGGTARRADRAPAPHWPELPGPSATEADTPHDPIDELLGVVAVPPTSNPRVDGA